VNILTFDIEEWFHILDNDSTRTDREWGRYESRIKMNMESIFHFLEMKNVKATFFCLGWIAETYPDIVKEIVCRGYEIGTHTRMHQLIYEQKPEEFKQDLERSVKTLEDLSGCKVKYFRAPGFSLREDNKWVFDILVSQGIEIDSSIFPAPRAHGGFPSFKNPLPSLVRYNGNVLKELPINYHSFMGKNFIFSGGGYFRMFPYYFIKKWTKESSYVMSYLHPRDFDPEQPVIKDLNMLRKFKSYVGLKSASGKFTRWLDDFEFIDINEANNRINWTEVPVIEV
jgi:polysaccharide deacetylase family protein (PEP-CTERM system associated)